jgi:hypothetical protein
MVLMENMPGDYSVLMNGADLNAEDAKIAEVVWSSRTLRPPHLKELVWFVAAPPRFPYGAGKGKDTKEC